MINLVDVKSTLYNATSVTSYDAVVPGRVRLLKIVARANAISSGAENATSPVYLLDEPRVAATGWTVTYQITVPATSSALNIQLNTVIDLGENGILFKDGIYSTLVPHPSTAPSCADFVNLFYA